MTASAQLSLAAFLTAHSTLSLATVDPTGQAMAASLFYVSDAALNVYWVSGASSRHSRNLEHNPRAALTVHNTTWTWTDIAGAQMEGAVLVVPPGPAWQAAWERYRAKFPFVAEFESVVARSNLYQFSPAWARLIDNAHGFGHKEELRF